MNPATRAAVAGARRSPRQLLLTGLAVLVATVFAAAAVLLTASLRADLLGNTSSVPAGATFALETDTSSGAATTELEGRLRALSGVTAVSTSRSGAVAVVAGGASGTWLLSTDPMTGPLQGLEPLTAGRLPAGPGEALVGASTAERTGLAPGATVGLGDRTLTVTGVVPVRSEGIDSLVVRDDDPAAAGLSAYRTAVAGKPDPTALAAVPGVTGVRTADDQRTEDLASASASADALLAGLSVFVGLALVAAAVVVASTFRIVLARRTRELALLRCVGAGRGQVVRSVLAEAALTGLVAGVAGAAVAVAGGWVALAAAGAAGMNAPALVVPWGRIAGCVLLAVVVTVLAALAPALAAGRTPPVVALGAADASGARAPRARVRLSLAAVSLVLAVLLAVAGVAMGSPLGGLVLAALSGMLVFAALVATGPFVVSGAAALVAPVVARWAPGRIAVGNARRMSRRTAAMTTVLSLGVGLTAAMLVAVAGASADVTASLERDYPADIVVYADAGEAASLAARLDAVPELTAREADSLVLVDPAPGVDPVAVRTAVVRAAGDAPVAFTAELREQAETTVGAVRGVGLGLVGVTLLVAVVGIGVTLALSVSERTREIALLRTLGLSRAASRRAVAIEAALAGAVAAVLGVVLGGVYGLLALTASGLGSLTVPPLGQLAGLAVAVVAVAVLASVGPLRRAGRIEPAHGVVAA
ncbi:putative ABC transporter integral membrane protein [Pseudonocardia sp. Ae406_Ps2]|uniref:FtsX-like permease family protein n=1 Tax=unclassified Pseudonocardia TaxID=2619320 RepID=UPI00094B74F5|nr:MULTISPECIES: FtsX-like permease family protein [unclassified Pseudonocardia]OLL97935.1 putative ABC transporter integral membrane protein [Pseudonocardia sp. Ae331_Ps2]OLM04357.1 putative ABC transporter integral membrane protein [Pseudonocardia sp. Ae406_Ps2]OLM25918.1 putative ABC transporter integral membrane protein [Pseudonocardia sp. Ae706_Ps2]